jgi:hypothetical protein
VSTVQSRITRWRERHAVSRRARSVRHATDAVSTRTLQQELQASTSAQINR